MSGRILITGANRGIGLALAREFVSRNFHVFACARSPEKADSLLKLQATSPAHLRLLRLDVNDEASIAEAVGLVTEERRTLDILVNNAAIFPEKGDERFEALDMDWFTEAFETNVTGTARVTKAFLPLLRLGRFPRIVNISSGAGSISTKEDSRYYCYGASKAALNMLTRTLANELQDIIVVAVSPGWVKTDMGGPNAELTPEESAAALAKTIIALSASDSGSFMGRDGSREDYAW